MFAINLKTECMNCGGVACLQQVGTSNEIIIEFLEDTPFICRCGTKTYLSLDKRIVEKNS